MVEGETLNVEERVEVDLGDLMARGNAVKEQAGDIMVKDVEAGEIDVGELVSPSPSVMMEIAGVSVGCIIDTGAEASVIPAEVFSDLLEPSVGPLGKLGHSLSITGVAGTDVPVAGYIRAPISVLGREVVAGFLVTTDRLPLKGRSRDFPILLGCNVLKLLVEAVKDGEDHNFLNITLDQHRVTVSTRSEPQVVIRRTGKYWTYPRDDTSQNCNDVNVSSRF